MSGATILLDPKLDLRTAGQLKDNILNSRGQNLSLDAAEVTQMGALGLQVIRSAAQTWAADGHTLELLNVSNECEDQLILLGFSSKSICNWEAA